MNEREEGLGWVRKPHSERREGVSCARVLWVPQERSGLEPCRVGAPQTHSGRENRIHGQ